MSRVAQPRGWCLVKLPKAPEYYALRATILSIKAQIESAGLNIILLKR